MPHRLRVHLVLIGLGGFAGAVARYLVDGWISGATGGG
jgi:fluoride ion exporter CrcB/FEX